MNEFSVAAVACLVVGALAISKVWTGLRRPGPPVPETVAEGCAANGVDVSLLEDEARSLLRVGKKVDAVVAVRKATGCGLKASKDFVDALESTLADSGA